MNILLANPRSSSVFQTFGFVFPSLGLLYVAAAAEKHGHTVRIKDFSINGESEDGYDLGGADIVGITSDTRRFPSAVKIATRAKELGSCVVMGGVHSTFVDTEILKAGYADFIVRGEGEITFPELLSTIESGGDLRRVNGISYLDRGELVRTPPRRPIEDLDTLPLPARHLVDMEAYKRMGLKYGGKRHVAVMSTSRGCPYDCSFCVTPQTSGRSWRARSAESIITEIEELYHKYGYRAIAFCEDNFTVSSKRVIEVANLIIERNLDLWWWCLSSPNILLKNEEMLRVMARAGVKTVYIGVESASPATLKEFNKNVEEDTAYKAVQLLKKHRIEVFASYIIGGLNDGVSEILSTIRLAKKLDTEVAQFTILTPYPGTTLYAKLKSRILHQKWHLYDGVHLVFRHEKVPYFLMHLLIMWAYISFYARGSRALKGFVKALVNNTPVFKKFFKTEAENDALQS